ncbi:hypothetical protein, partial [Lentzea flava]|uniref:hypothetical protein n=1 Tax=Lentzea flava TaxID=103732 RepID=UPI0035560907
MFKVLPWRPGQLVHHVVTMDPSRPIDQNNWHPGMLPEQGAHEYGHMLGLVDENLGGDGGVRVEGTLMGWWDPEKVDSGRLRMDADQNRLDPDDDQHDPRYAEVLEWHISGFAQPEPGDAPVWEGRVTAPLPPGSVVPAAPDPHREHDRQPPAESNPQQPQATPTPSGPSRGEVAAEPAGNTERLDVPRRGESSPRIEDRDARPRTPEPLTPGRSVPGRLRRESAASGSHLSPSFLPRGKRRRGSSYSSIGDEQARAYRARFEQPEIKDQPDFSRIRSSLLDQIVALKETKKDWETWIGQTFTDTKLKQQFDRSLGGIREVWRGFEIEVHVPRIGPPSNAVDDTADLTKGETVEEAKEVSAGQVTSEPLNPLQGTVPAGPVNISFAASGVIGNASERGTETTKTAQERIEISQPGAQRTQSRHDVQYRVRIQPPAGHFQRTQPEPREWTLSVPMTLSWPKRRDIEESSVLSESSAPGTPRTDRRPSETLVYPEFPADADASVRARTHARFQSQLKALEHARFVDIGDVFRKIRQSLSLRADDPEVTELGTWLYGLGPKCGTELVKGKPESKTFSFQGRKPIEITVARELLPDQGGTSHPATTAQRTVRHIRSGSQEHSVTKSGKHAAGFELGVSTGETLAESLGAKLELSVNAGKVNENLVQRASAVRQELIESVKGDFVDDTRVFPFMVVMSELDGHTHLASQDAGTDHRFRRHSRGEASPPTLHVTIAAVLLFAPQDTDNSDSGSSHGSANVQGSAPAGKRDPSGLRRDEVLDYRQSRSRLTERAREAVIVQVVQNLYALGYVSGADDVNLLQRRLRRFLRQDAKELRGGDPKRFPLPGKDKDLYFGGAADPGQVRYKGVASKKELKGYISASDQTKLTNDRKRSKGFKVAVEGDAGIAELGGEIEVSRTKQRQGELTEVVEEEHPWTGEDVPVHLYEGLLELTVRTGRDWNDLDEPMRWREPAPDPQDAQPAGPQSANTRSTITAKIEIAVRQRPGREANIGPREDDAETGWIDARTPTTLVPSFRRVMDLPKRIDLDSQAVLADLGSETMAMLAVPEPEEFKDKVKDLAKLLVTGKTPVQLGMRGAEHAGVADASRRALEEWVSWQSREGRMGLAEGPGDELWVENYNRSGAGTVEFGSRRIVGTVKLSTTHGNGRIIGVDPEHEFASTYVTRTTVKSGEMRRTGPEATVGAKAGLGEKATLEAEASLGYQRESESTETVTVETRTTIKWVERGYLFEVDEQDLLSTSVKHSWTGPFGGHHDGPVIENKKLKYRPRAVKAWVTAGEIPSIGELSSHDIEHNLHPEDRRAYEARHRGQSEPAQSPEDVEAEFALGTPEPLRPDMALTIMTDIRAQLRDYEKTIKDPDVRAEYAGLHDEMVQTFGTQLQLGGLKMLTNMQNGGVPVFGERVGEPGKLEQMLVVRAERTDNRRLDPSEKFGVRAQVTTTRKQNTGKKSVWSRAVSVALPPSMPEWIGARVTEGLISPNAGLEAETGRGQENRSLVENLASYEFSGGVDRLSSGLKIYVQVRPWARSGMYRQHVPGLRQAPLHEVHDLPGFELPQAIQTAIPSIMDLSRAPLDTVDTPLSQLTQGRELLANTTIRALPFPAKGLHKYLIGLVPDLNSGRAYTLLASTTATQLADHFITGLSPDGYVVDIGSKSVATARLSFDLGKRELREIPGATLHNGRSTVDNTVEEVDQTVNVTAGVLGGLIGEGAVEKTLVEKKSETPEAEPEAVKEKPHKAYLVRAELRPTVTLTYRTGKTSEPFRPGEDGADGIVWLLVDQAGAQALGFTVPGAVPGTAPDAMTDDPPALASAYTGAMSGVGDLALSQEALKSWIADVVALSSPGSVEQNDLLDATTDLLRRVSDALGAVPDSGLHGQVRALVNDAVLATSLTPVRDRGDRSVRLLSPDRLDEVLDDIAAHLERGENPFTTTGSFVHGIDYRPDSALAARLAVLGTVNLDDTTRRRVLTDPLFAMLIANPAAATEALFASTGHEPRYFRTTGEPAAVNMALRDRAPTIVPLLHAGETVAKAVEDGLVGTSPEFRTHKDHVLGRTQGQRVRDRVAAARQEFASIRDRAVKLSTATDQDPAAWRELTARWSRTMQKLAATDLTGSRLPVLTPETMPGHPRLSGVASAAKNIDKPLRRHARADVAHYVAVLGTVLTPDPGGTRLGIELVTNSSQVPLSSRLTTPHAQYGFWSWLAAGSGHVLRGTGDAVYIRAVRLGGRDLIAVGDTRRSEQKLVSLPDFSALARKNGWTAPQSLLIEDPESVTPDLVVGTVDSPVPLVDLVSGEFVDLSDVVAVSLADGRGGVGGVFFPAPGEAAIVERAFELGAGDSDAYSRLTHRGEDGFFYVWKSDGAPVRLDAAGVYRLYSGIELPGGQLWRSKPRQVWLSCRVADLALGDALGEFRGLLGLDGYQGESIGPRSGVRVFEDGRIEYLDDDSLSVAGDPAVRYVDLAPPVSPSAVEQVHRSVDRTEERPGATN